MSRPARKIKPAAVRRSRPAAVAQPVPSAAAAAPNVDRINAINVGLMLLSAAIAWVLPFELFVLSYAVLGPLHYLTQISWLHDRGYFTTSRWDALPLAAFCLLAFLSRYLGVFEWDGWVLAAFLVAGALAFTPSPGVKMAVAVVALAATVFVERWGAGFLILIVLLPTVIHVSLFTGLFILQGSVRTGSLWGYASFAVYVLCSAVLLLYRPAAGHYSVDPRTSVLVREFGSVIDALAQVTGTRAQGGYDAFVAIGRFLGFAYTYHYLNWFSKTGIIRWHTVSGRRLAAIGALYAASLAVYAYDYATGLVALFFLSLLHVLLEFPLDIRTIAGLASRPLATAR